MGEGWAGFGLWCFRLGEGLALGMLQGSVASSWANAIRTM